MTEPLTWLQENAPILAPTGVVIGATIAIVGQQLTNRSNRKAQRAHDTYDRRAEAYVDYIRVLQTCPYVPNSAQLDELKIYNETLTKWLEKCQDQAAPLYAYASKTLLPKFTDYQRGAERSVQLIAAKYREVQALWHVGDNEDFHYTKAPQEIYPVFRELKTAHTTMWESTTAFIGSMRDDLGTDR